MVDAWASGCTSGSNASLGEPAAYQASLHRIGVGMDSHRPPEQRAVRGLCLLAFTRWPHAAASLREHDMMIIRSLLMMRRLHRHRRKGAISSRNHQDTTGWPYVFDALQRHVRTTHLIHTELADDPA